MFKKVICLFSFLVPVCVVHGQQVRPLKSAEIYREIRTLQHLPKVLYLAAHPDDENTGLLSWLVNDQQVETAYLSLTRGDGGQNLLGTEQGAALGFIRTHELLEARKLDGAKQFFTRAIDFGFSKNTNDTFKQWDADSITADVVWVIRKFRPDVIICRFPPTAAAGHGQHAASAVIAEKAFKLAGDKTKFPNQLKFVDTWQPTRLLWNTFNFGSVNTTAENQLKFTIGQYDPLLGMGYGELAGISRSLHKSQGAGTRSVPGIRNEYFAQVAGTAAKSSLFDGVGKTFSDKGLAEIDQDIAKIITNFNFNQPDASLSALLALRVKMLNIRDRFLRKDKLEALDKIIVSCAGFMGEVVTNQPEMVAGQEANFRLNLIARSKLPIVVEGIAWLDEKDNIKRVLAADSLITFERKIQIPANAALTEPYWLANQAKNAAQFNVPVDTLIGKPEDESALLVRVNLKIDGMAFMVQLPLSYKKLDPVKGDVVEALRIIPPVELQFSQPVYLLQNGDKLTLTLNVKNNTDKTYHNGKLIFRLGSQVVKTIEGISLTEKNKIFDCLIEANKLTRTTDTKLSVIFETNGLEFGKNKQLIQYPHLPTLQYFLPATAQLMKGDLQVKVKKVGYVMGAGDFIPEFLNEAGIAVEVLKDEDFYGSTQPDKINPKFLSYDAIVMGVRANNTEKRLDRWMPYIWAYVQNGGTLLMQYNTTQDATLNQLGIYPFSIANKRVTEENSAVKFLLPNHRLLNYPNKITQSDFEGWVQERGAYFTDKWDSKYEALFEMHDTNEEPLQGSTLYTTYGKGHFIYSPLAFFRQLPAGNAGAARLFFNFLSVGK
ncbi:PIG-L family deacetylase [Pedobacter sp. MW01-1-1]|uniref:PIG-L family deacetylase n=1 Tax=Pedobacter sp. MW01-1-1 TaxID=3383027 RepID=UPI003FEE0E5C